MEKFKTFTMWFTLALIVAGFVSFELPDGEEPTFCTLDAMQCPDGSYVGRTGPKCEFAACPAPEADKDWATLTDEETGISFRYPEKFFTIYIDAYDWPPQVRTMEGPLVCAEAGEIDGRAGRTEERMVDDRIYCVTEVVGVAAGSMYTQYAYSFEKDGRVVILTLTSRASQCGNYEDPLRDECEREREAFDIDGVIDRVARSVRFE